eukprot:6333306-Alexandrium_andersonii.AAC.1
MRPTLSTGSCTMPTSTLPAGSARRRPSRLGSVWLRSAPTDSLARPARAGCCASFPSLRRSPWGTR